MLTFRLEMPQASLRVMHCHTWNEPNYFAPHSDNCSGDDEHRPCLDLCSFTLLCSRAKSYFWFSLSVSKGKSIFNNFYYAASPWRWQYHCADTDNEPDTPPLGKSKVRGMEETDMASKHLCIKNSGISNMEFNVFPCVFHCFPQTCSVEISLPVSLIRAGSLPALRCPLNDLCSVGF